MNTHNVYTSVFNMVASTRIIFNFPYIIMFKQHDVKVDIYIICDNKLIIKV